MSQMSKPRYAPNISWLFPELPFDRRPQAALEAGFTTVEFGFPSHADLAALEVARTDWGLDITLFNQDVPVWDEVNRGTLSDPGRRDEFKRELERALGIARRLEVEKIMLPAGVVLPDLDRRAQIDCMLENLSRAASLARDAGCMLTLEVLNPHDNPGYFLTRYVEALEIIRRLNHPVVRFQLDTYHIQRIEGDVIPAIQAGAGLIGHVQFADHPGRHEPGTGAIDFQAVQVALAEAGYQGAIGLEYIPLAPGQAALDWLPADRRKAGAASTDIERSSESKAL
jgi:hydroxypyruvate isomerase